MGCQARKAIAAQESPFGFFFSMLVERKRCIMSFVATHWSHVLLLVIIGIVVVPTTVAGFELVRFLRELFRKPRSIELDA